MLALPEVQGGGPEILAGGDRLDRPVRWVHIAEVPDIARLLRGGELILCTGVALPETAAGLAGYAEELAAAGAVGLFVELGRRYRQMPPALIGAARRAGLPLVALHREVPFVLVTEAVHSLIVNAHYRLLQASEEVHRVFTELTVEGASTAQVLRTAVELAGAPAVLENVAHQVLHCEPGGRRREVLLRDWEARSRRARGGARTGVVGEEGWLATDVGARGQRWGRLVVLVDGPPTSTQAVVAERAATALALSRLLERDRDSLERQAHRSLLTDIVDRTWSSAADVHARSRALGVPTEGCALVALVVRLEPQEDADEVAGQARIREAAEAVADGARRARVACLVAPLEPGEVGLLVPLPSGSDRAGVLDRLAVAVHEALGSIAARIGAGSTVADLADVRRSCREAAQVAEAAAGAGRDRPFYELPDVRLRGLLHLLRDDDRLQAFVERELGPLLEHDQAHGTDLAGALRAYLAAGRNKSAAADGAHLSRPALYARLAAVERVLEVDLDAVEGCLSLHVALLVLDAQRAPRDRVSGRPAPG